MSWYIRVIPAVKGLKQKDSKLAVTPDYVKSERIWVCGMTADSDVGKGRDFRLV